MPQTGNPTRFKAGLKQFLLRKALPMVSFGKSFLHAGGTALSNQLSAGSDAGVVYSRVLKPAGSGKADDVPVDQYFGRLLAPLAKVVEKQIWVYPTANKAHLEACAGKPAHEIHVTAGSLLTRGEVASIGFKLAGRRRALKMALRQDTLPDG